MSRVLPRFAAPLLGLLLLGGGSGGCLRNPPWKRIQTGRVLTPGVVIRAEDGSFTFRAGAPFRAPFHAKDCVAWAVHSNWKLALKWGARRVRVTVPGLPQPLYGVLSLCEVHPKKAGSGLRSFDLKVPAGAVTLTATGQTVVVVKESAYGRRFRDGFHRFDVWQLWLSRYPFPR